MRSLGLRFYGDKQPDEPEFFRRPVFVSMSEPIPLADFSGDSVPLPRVGLLACEVFADEIEMEVEASRARIVVRKMFEIGLHDRPEGLRAVLQQAVTEIDIRDDLDAVVLAYRLCGLGTAGLRAGRYPLVIPRTPIRPRAWEDHGKRYSPRMANSIGYRRKARRSGGWTVRRCHTHVGSGQFHPTSSGPKNSQRP